MIKLYNTKNIAVLKTDESYCENCQNLFVDLDGCFLKTSECIIKIFQSLFKSDGDDFCKWSIEQCLSELKYWNYSNFTQGRLNNEELAEIFNSNAFFKNVEFDPDFVEMLNNLREQYNIIFITKGSKENLQKKLELLTSWKEQGIIKFDFYFIGVLNKTTKNVVDMSGGIQIDDNYEYLIDTNANLKILYRNKYCNESDYNGVQVIDGTLSNLYITEFVDEIKTILFYCL